MEKFGIFELLDTLSAILDDENAPRSAPPAAAAPETQDPPPAPPDVKDRSFLPPNYNAAKSTLSSFLEKHDETVKRIEKKK